MSLEHIIFTVLMVAASGWIYRLFATKRAAKNIMRDTQAAYSTLHEYRRVSLEDFPRLNHAFFHESQRFFESQGFRFVADMENVTLKGIHKTMTACLRCMVNADGTIQVAIYDVHYRGFMRLLQFIGILPMDFRTVDIETEFTNGTFLTTTNAEMAAKMGVPPSMTRVFYPRGTPLATMLTCQLALLENWKDEFVPRRIRTFDEIVASQNRAQHQKNLYRHSVGIVSDQEMRAIGGGMFPGEAEGVIREMHKMRPGVPPEYQSAARPEEGRGY